MALRLRDAQIAMMHADNLLHYWQNKTALATAALTHCCLEEAKAEEAREAALRVLEGVHAEARS
jgi:hypothetical protein